MKHLFSITTLGLVLLLITGAPLLTSCAQQKRPAPAVPQKMVVRDGKGIERAVINIGDNRADLVVRNEQGTSLFELHISEEGLHLEVVDEEGEPQSLSITPERIEE